MKITLTTLSENFAGMSDVLAEWGLSILVEADGFNVLLDAGQGMSASYNADVLGVDLKRIDRIVLSHGHFDHTGGLRPLLQKTKREVEVVAHPDIWSNKYRRRKGQADRYVGIPYRRSELESLGAVFNMVREPFRLSETIMTSGEIPMVTEFERIDSGLYVREGDKWLDDELLDDRALIVKSDRGLVVVLGCAHRGVINTLRHAQKLTGVEQVYAVVGGAHLFSAGEERVWMTIAALKDSGVQKLGLCHCTGLSVMALLVQEFGEGFFYNSVGTKLEIA